MKILIIYYLHPQKSRNTIREHIYSFKYSEEQCYYLNAFYRIPEYIISINFDLIIYHYTFLALKWDKVDWLLNKYEIFTKLKGYKIAIPQDEYINSYFVSKFFKKYNVKSVFTLAFAEDWEKLYPKDLSGLDNYYTVLAGYINDEKINRISRFIKPYRERKIDVGYRARKNPFWLGKHSVMKWKIAEEFLKYKNNFLYKNSSLKFDISINPEDVIYEENWYKFLSNCRVVLGCEAGASLFDYKGEIRSKVDKYMMKNPLSEYDEVCENCFPNRDFTLNYFMISPRVFESCLTKTTQVLIEGYYNGIIKPGIHYIELKKDWSNIKEVIEKIKDIEYCEKIAERAYEDIVASNKFTYSNWVDDIFLKVKERIPIKIQTGRKEKKYLRLLELRDKYKYFFFPFNILRYKCILFVSKIAFKFDLKNNKFYKNLKKGYIRIFKDI